MDFFQHPGHDPRILRLYNTRGEVDALVRRDREGRGDVPPMSD